MQNREVGASGTPGEKLAWEVGGWGEESRRLKLEKQAGPRPAAPGGHTDERGMNFGGRRNQQQFGSGGGLWRLFD